MVKFPVSTVGMNRNATFTVIDDDLRLVHEVLTGVEEEEMASDGQSDAKHFGGRKTVPACCILHGLAGIGKTDSSRIHLSLSKRV